MFEIFLQAHSDFTLLRQMLISKDMINLKNETNIILYENYRSQKLSLVGAYNQVIYQQLYLF